ncbi:McKusick-Kaufman/Bardet-Biedl syndromes putative chaperonin isoform X2 [Esox lucius]|uniref:McKusick-Kaufman/Bardet-Biedl syndromes putative chaperonin isoform X2 n=1 Tax=Esox lucius TaxID=8010 RepID=UPI0009733B85|nr:McKusick-Kaufman/Bardet-Biedl syndromes putative chaperonin isoform X2 [Esox lucius]
MARLSKKTPSVCTDNPLSKSEVNRKITLMREILDSSFGPNGRLKQIHNNVGGHVLTTSTSSSLLQAFYSSEPLLKLINASILNHVSRFSDCGLYVGILCLSLIKHVQESDLRPSVAISMNKHLLELCTSYLKHEDCNCKVTIDLGSCRSLVTLARSVISSKPGSMLTEKEKQHIGTLTVHAFLLTVPDGETSDTVRLGRTVMVAMEGQSVLDSAVFHGLLVDVPDVLLHSIHAERITLRPGPFRLALFSVSLSGDLSALGKGSLEVPSGAPDPEDVVLEQLLGLGEQVVNNQVDVFMCQRVIHPVLQQYLRKHGVLVIERLGIALIDPIVQMTGAQAVASYQTPISPEAYGQVKGICVRTVGPRILLHLLPPEEPASTICTMVVCHRNETMLNELKSAIQKAEHVLRLTLRDPVALLGGGCTETLLAAYCRNKVHQLPLEHSHIQAVWIKKMAPAKPWTPHPPWECLGQSTFWGSMLSAFPWSLWPWPWITMGEPAS